MAYLDLAAEHLAITITFKRTIILTLSGWILIERKGK